MNIKHILKNTNRQEEHSPFERMKSDKKEYFR